MFILTSYSSNTVHRLASNETFPDLEINPAAQSHVVGTVETYSLLFFFFLIRDF